MKKIVFIILIMLLFTFNFCIEAELDLPGNNKRTWTIMYYCDGDNDVEKYLMNNINEMEGVNITVNKVNVVALVDRIDGYYDGDGDWTNTRAFLLGCEGSYNSEINYNVTKRLSIPELNLTEQGTELNMGSQDTLEKFISFCMNDYPADHYMLIFYNHGGGWRSNETPSNDPLKAVCWDDTDGGDYLETKEIRLALENTLSENKIDIIVFEACLMGMVEVAYEYKDVADIMVSSASTMFAIGFPYTQIWKKIRKSDDITPRYFAATIVNQYDYIYKTGGHVESPSYTNQNITMSAIDLSKMDDLSSKINTLADEILNNDCECIQEREETLEYKFYENVELWDFCDKVKGKYSSANSVKNAIDNSVIKEANGTTFEEHHGMAIYLPETPTSYYAYSPYRYTEDNIRFAADTLKWVELVNTGLTTDFRNDDYETYSDNGYTGNDTWEAGYNNSYNHLSNNGVPLKFGRKRVK